MDPRFEEAFEQFLLHNTEFPGRQWERSEDYRRAERKRKKILNKLKELMPPEHYEQADDIFEDIDGTYNKELDFYYLYGIHDGVELLKLLGAL